MYLPSWILFLILVNGERFPEKLRASVESPDDVGAGKSMSCVLAKFWKLLNLNIFFVGFCD